MTQPFSLTQKGISPLEGMYAYVPNLPQLHNVIFTSTTATDVAYAGSVVKHTTSDNVTPSVTLAAVGDAPFGVVVYDPRVSSYKVGDKLAIAQTGDIIYMVASETLVAGAELEFDADTRQVATAATSGSSIIGTAITSAVAGQLVQVELNFNLGQVA